MLNKLRSIISKRLFRWSTLAILIVLLSYGFYSLGVHSVYTKYPSLYSKEQAVRVLQKIGQFMQLPKNENPEIAIIKNAEEIKKSQPFLKKTVNGDILIVYKTANEAILYRPSTNKVISVGPIYKYKSQNVTKNISQKTHGGTVLLKSKQTSTTTTKYAGSNTPPKK